MNTPARFATNRRGGGPVRVLLVIDSLAWGGSQRQMANLAVGLRGRGHDVDLFRYFPAYDHYRDLVAEAGVTLLDFEKRRKFDPGVVSALAGHMRSRRHDVAVAYLAGPSAFTVIASKLAGGPPVVVSERGSFRPGKLPLYARLQRVTHRFAAHVVANSFHQAERMRREFPWLADRVSTIWNGIDTDRFMPVERPCDPAEPLRVLGVGTVVPIKDIETLAQALVVAGPAAPVEVSWAGNVLDTPASRGVVERVDALLGAHDLRSRWRWLGLQRDMPALYAGCDAVVHPSAREGLPNALCEALAAGRPSIAARAADHERLLGAADDGARRGLLFETGDATSLAQALVAMANAGPAGRAALGANARRFAGRELSLDACLDRYEALLQKIVS
jgi:glycosyltransferase involved in cell wall biosynthesis